MRGDVRMNMKDEVNQMHQQYWQSNVETMKVDGRSGGNVLLSG